MAATLSEAEVQKLAGQLSFQDLADDWLLAEENKAEWDARIDRDKEVIEYKLLNEDHKDKVSTEKVHEASGLTTRQLVLPLGDYQLVSDETVRSTFNKNIITDAVKLRRLTAQNEQANYAEPPIADSVTDLQAEVRRLSRLLVDQKVELLEQIQGDLNQCTTYSTSRTTQPKYVGSK